MTHDRISLIVLLGLTLCLPGCVGYGAEGVSPNASDSKTAGASKATLATSGSGNAAYDAVPDHWLGQWNGPEGTSLRIAGGKGRYEITIRNLDGPRVFDGSAANGQIQFERNGIKESIRASNGRETGMKWLSEKSVCLTVRAGEGYCRD